MGRLEEMYRRSLDEPEAFWAAAAAAIEWDEPWQRVIDDSRAPLYRWFAGGRMNTCYNALDRHVERGRADQPALIYDSPVTDTVATFTYRELRDAVARFAGALAAQGVARGDRVIVYMPMVPEAVIAMLACARLGAIHSVVFGGFAANELATRIEDAKPKVIVSASCGIEPARLVEYKPLLDAAIDMERRAGWSHADGLRLGGCNRSALHPLYVRDDWTAERDRPRQRRPRGGARLDYEEHLRRRSGRGLLGRL
jgi:propionyl-CoA synthetase